MHVVPAALLMHRSMSCLAALRSALLSYAIPAALCAHLAAQLDRWHRLLLTPEGLRGIPTLMLSASVKKGATLHIRTPHGAESTIEYMPSS